MYPVTDHYLPEIARTIHWREMGDEYTPDTNVDLVASVVVYLARSQPMVSPYRYRNIICRLLPWEQLPWKWFPWRLLIVAIGTTLQPFHWLNCYPHFLHCGGESRREVCFLSCSCAPLWLLTILYDVLLQYSFYSFSVGWYLGVLARLG